MQTWTHGTASQEILRRHLARKHDKKPSWLEENREDLAVAHLSEHNFGRAHDHGPKDVLTQEG